MKRILVSVFSIMVLLSFINTTQVMAKKNDQIIVKVDAKDMIVDKVAVNLNGKELKADVPGIVYNGNTLLPVRALAEKLGATLEWDDKNNTATIKTADKTIVLKENESVATVNGKKEEILNKAMIKSIATQNSDGKRFMAPLRFISESLGADVQWVNEPKTANITSKQEDAPTPVKPEEDKKPVIEKEPEVKLNRIKSIIAKDVDGSKIPEIHIEGESEIKYKNTTSNSKVITIDVADSLIDERDIPENCDAIKKISAKQLNSDGKDKTVRITIELNDKLDDLEYEIKDNKGNKKLLIIKIINKLAGIEKQIIDGKEAIVIKNVYSSKNNSFSLSNPSRLVVDVRNTNLNNVGSQVSTDVVKELRLGQYTGHEYDPTEKVARIVLDISENYENPRHVIEERGNDLIIFVEGTKKTPVATVPKEEPSIDSQTPPVVTPPSSDDNTTTKQKVIVIDAGHGGSDPGASYNGLRETDLTLSVALKTKDKLEALGYKVIMVRSTDVHLSANKSTDLGLRTKLANDNNADAFISIHINAATAPSATGIETYYSPKSGQDRAGFAKAIQDELINGLGARNRGVKTANFAVIKNTKMVSVLTELGFISNQGEAKQMATDAFQEKAANAIANGAHKYLSK